MAAVMSTAPTLTTAKTNKLSQVASLLGKNCGVSCWPVLILKALWKITSARYNEHLLVISIGLLFAWQVP